jgi:hypothetical protein
MYLDDYRGVVNAMTRCSRSPMTIVVAFSASASK